MALLYPGRSRRAAPRRRSQQRRLAQPRAPSDDVAPRSAGAGRRLGRVPRNGSRSGIDAASKTAGFELHGAEILEIWVVAHGRTMPCTNESWALACPTALRTFALLRPGCLTANSPANSSTSAGPTQPRVTGSFVLSSLYASICRKIWLTKTDRRACDYHYVLAHGSEGATAAGPSLSALWHAA